MTNDPRPPAHLLALAKITDRLSDDDAALFDRYCAAALDLRRSRLLSHVPTTVAFAPDGLILPPAKGTEESREAFESLCLRFRRIRLASDDDPVFYRARNRLGRFVYESSIADRDRDAVVEWLKALKARVQALDDRWVMGQVLGGARPISPAEGLELVFNGHLFHRAYETERELTQMVGWQWTLIGQLLLQIEALSKLYWELAEGLGVLFANADLLPEGFDATLKTTLLSGSDGHEMPGPS